MLLTCFSFRTKVEKFVGCEKFTATDEDNPNKASSMKPSQMAYYATKPQVIK